MPGRREIPMRLRERSTGQEVVATVPQTDTRERGFPTVRTDDGFVLSLGSLLVSHEVVEANPEERTVLRRSRYLFGGTP
jgi:hypothetical protein